MINLENLLDWAISEWVKHVLGLNSLASISWLLIGSIFIQVRRWVVWDYHIGLSVSKDETTWCWTLLSRNATRWYLLSGSLRSLRNRPWPLLMRMDCRLMAHRWRSVFGYLQRRFLHIKLCKVVHVRWRQLPIVLQRTAKCIEIASCWLSLLCRCC